MDHEDVWNDFALESQQLRYASMWRSNWGNGGWDIPTEYSTALYIYSLERPNICKAFNQCCREACSFAGSIEGWDDFPYKCFWWLLLDSLLYLPEEPVEPVLYRGLRHVDADNIASRDTVVFGQFVSATEERGVAERFARLTGVVLELRNVPSSLCRRLGDGAYRADHQEVLLMPFCFFSVVDDEESSSQYSSEYDSDEPDNEQVDVVVLEYDRCMTYGRRTKRRILSRWCNRQRLSSEDFRL